MKNRTRKPWICTYLYYEAPYDNFFFDCLYPLVKELTRKKLIKQFFFIRYFDKGAHIRLRVKVDYNLRVRLRKQLRSYFMRYFKKHPSKRVKNYFNTNDQTLYPNNSVKFFEYEPETERFGGSKGIKIAEELFQASSLATLEIFHNNRGLSYDKILGFALQLNVGMIVSLNLSKLQTKILLKNISNYNRNNSSLYKNILEKQKSILFFQISDLFSKINKGCKFSPNWYNNWIKSVNKVRKKLKKINNQNLKKINLIPIVESYIHLTNNRLGVRIEDEPYLAYIIKSWTEK